MASAPAPTPAVPPPPAEPNEITIFSHSNLFYWWPVWLLGLVLGLLTLTSGEYMVIVPADAKVSREHLIWTGKGEQPEKREGVIFEPAKPEELKRHLPPNHSKEVITDEKTQPSLKEHFLHSTSRKGYGVIFATVLLVVIFITNVPLRGMWSYLIIMGIVMLSIIFALAGWWDNIMRAISLLDIRMTAGGYFFIALGLLVLWSVAFYFFDRQIYVVFTPKSVQLRLEIGEGAKEYDILGMVVEKVQSDMFRHLMLGLGSGDMIIKVTGAAREEFRLNNVLFINRKLAAINRIKALR